MTTRVPFFTIGIPTRNRTGLLAEALRSVLDQGFEDWEVVLVDDGGDMAISPTLEAMLKDRRIRQFRHETTLGRGAGRQRVIDEAAGKWLLWLDDDDIFTDEALGNIAGALEGFHGPMAAFQTTVFEVNAKVWLTVAQVGFDAVRFANVATEVATSLATGQDASNHFVNLWSKVGRVEFYRKFGFVTDPKDLHSSTCEDLDFLIRAIQDVDDIPELTLPAPAYIFRALGPDIKAEQAQEPAKRVSTVETAFDRYRDFYAKYCDDAAYEMACMRYFSGGEIYSRFKQYDEAWRLRAQTAVGAGGTLFDFFIMQVMNDAPVMPGVRQFGDPSTPIEITRTSKAFPPVTLDGLLGALSNREAGGEAASVRQINGRFKVTKHEYASPSQLTEGALLAGLPDTDWSVFGIDWHARQWTMVDVPYTAVINSGTAAYADQFDISGAVRRTPWGALGRGTGQISGTSQDSIMPVFSMGRCGSAALGRLLVAAGSDVISGLDTFTHLGMAANLCAQGSAPRAGLERLTHELVSHLAGAGHGTRKHTRKLVLEMRRQASGVACLLDRKDTPQVVFLVREIEDWYRSCTENYTDTAQELASGLAASFQDMNAALDRGIDVRVVTYDSICNDPAAVLNTIKGAASSKRVMGKVMAAHRQAEISPAHDQAKKRGSSSETYDDFKRAWSALRDPAILERLGLDLCIRPLKERAV